MTAKCVTHIFKQLQKCWFGSILKHKAHILGHTKTVERHEKALN